MSNNPFAQQSDRYRKYRPTYPARLFDFLAATAPANELAWDCATGNGQAAQGLGACFKQVIATDISREQIDQAEPAQNIDYRVSVAEDSGIESASVDLVTVAQALHWFNIGRFFGEASRVLKPRGVLAVWSYNLLTVDAVIDALLHRLYAETLGEYWPFERKMVEDGYAGIEFPFAKIPTPDFAMHADWSLQELIGYLQTWSALKKYQQQNAADPLSDYRIPLQDAWGDPLRSKRISWPLSLTACRKR